MPRPAVKKARSRKSPNPCWPLSEANQHLIQQLESYNAVLYTGGLLPLRWIEGKEAEDWISARKIVGPLTHSREMTGNVFCNTFGGIENVWNRMVVEWAIENSAAAGIHLGRMLVANASQELVHG